MSDARDDEPTNPLNLLGALTKVLSEAHDNVEDRIKDLQLGVQLENTKVSELEEDLKQREVQREAVKAIVCGKTERSLR